MDQIIDVSTIDSIINNSSVFTESFGERLRKIEEELPDVDDINLHGRIFNIVLILFYSLLAIISLIGNGLVCRVLLGSKPSSYTLPQSSSSSTGTSKMLIVNLAISDLLLTTFNIPMNIVRFVSRDWPFGAFLCTMMPFIQSVSAYCSAWTMMVIAFERYRKIFHPKTMLRLQNLYKQRQSKHHHHHHHHHQPTSAVGEGSLKLNNQPSPNAIRYSVTGESCKHQVEISLSPRQHQQQQTQFHSKHNRVILQKLSPDICQSFGRILSYFGYCCCAYCCCCCPMRWMPSPPSSSIVNHQTSSSSKRSCLPSWFCGCFSCYSSSMDPSRHCSPISIVTIIWTISLILSIPHSLFSKIVHHDYVDMTRCTINAFPNEQTKHYLTIYTLITQYIFPIGITSFCYLHIGIFLWRRETIGLISERRRIFLLQRKRKRVRLLIMVVATFAICWFPLNLYILLTDFGFIAHHLFHWFAMSSVCYNPFIYCWLNEMFRQKTTSILKCLLWNPCLTLINRSRWCWICCWKSTGPFSSTPISTVCDQINTNGQNGGQNLTTLTTNGWHLDGNENCQANGVGSLTSWSSTTMSGNTTGHQQAISELISMSAFLEQQQEEQNCGIGNGGGSIGTGFVTKEQRLALMTTQAGRRRYHSGQLILMLTKARSNFNHINQSLHHNHTSHSNNNSDNYKTPQKTVRLADLADPEPTTKTTSLNICSFSSNSSTTTSPSMANSGTASSDEDNEIVEN